jgi:hypothetical protein
VWGAGLEFQCLEFHGVGGFAVEDVQDGGGVFLEGRDVLAAQKEERVVWGGAESASTPGRFAG